MNARAGLEEGGFSEVVYATHAGRASDEGGGTRRSWTGRLSVPLRVKNRGAKDTIRSSVGALFEMDVDDGVVARESSWGREV